MVLMAAVNNVISELTVMAAKKMATDVVKPATGSREPAMPPLNWYVRPGRRGWR
ncbi:hypothetical protein BMONG18_0210 [Bifidobacterium mongoliense]|uniref:Uncharacterized protein n=1 Tax=Bifidobacterium mongoliense TaxID=518643 RepID=A0A423UG41_9BIFI|nr:hypothetical protein BMONG18_0210 [Bifidobacterium mongoliense]